MGLLQTELPFLAVLVVVLVLVVVVHPHQMLVLQHNLNSQAILELMDSEIQAEQMLILPHIMVLAVVELVLLVDLLVTDRALGVEMVELVNNMVFLVHKFITLAVVLVLVVVVAQAQLERLDKVVVVMLTHL